jgi:DNA-binding NarL/FixJ family response regulator
MSSRQPQRSFFDPEMLAKLGEAASAWPATTTSETSKIQGHLTARESLILAEIVRGSSSKEVARALEISPRTVEFHRANVMQKLGAKNSADLVRRVLGE